MQPSGEEKTLTCIKSRQEESVRFSLLLKRRGKKKKGTTRDPGREGGKGGVLASQCVERRAEMLVQKNAKKTPPEEREKTWCLRGRPRHFRQVRQKGLEGKKRGDRKKGTALKRGRRNATADIQGKRGKKGGGLWEKGKKGKARRARKKGTY